MAGISMRQVSSCARVAFRRDARIACGEQKDVTGFKQLEDRKKPPSDLR